jgi:1-acyl-sn-glycerol-3-phosphate acyltransferase
MSADWYARACLLLYALVAAAVVTLQARRAVASWQLWVLHVISRIFTPLMFQQRLEGGCSLPALGGALVIGNHRSPTDPMLIFSGSPCKRDGFRIRPVEFLTAREYTEIGGFIGFVCRHMQSIPVERDGRDMDSAKRALRRLQHDHLVGIFPEGRINTGSGLLPGNPGVAWLALKGGKPVIPVFIHDAPQPGGMVRPFLTPCKVRVIYGEPVDLSRFAGQKVTPDLLNRVTDLLMQRLAETGGIQRAPLTVVPNDPPATTRASA